MLYFTMTGMGVVGGGRFRVSLACPDSEWLDPRRNVFELGGKLPPALRQGLEGTLRGAARAWKIAAGNSPGLVLDSTNAFSALRSGASAKGKDMEALGLTQTPGDPTARACLAACIELILSGATQTDAGHKQFVALAGAVAVMNPQMGEVLVARLQLAGSHKDEENELLERRNRVDPNFIHHRKLTSGEIALAMTVFGTTIPYDLVKVHDHQYPFLFGQQPDDTLVAPDGDIYADRDGEVYSDDYSKADFGSRATFIHEMAHVWQDRVMGIFVWFRGPFERNYKYTIIPGKRFLDYKLEEQAAIVEDYFRFLNGQKPRWGRPTKNGISLDGNEALDVYRRLIPFLNKIWT